ncbi:hypothetical protein N7516_001702 [Penicillium verrucosum]|uniref:uncharacterized protein n=1 Tax=Penicillium verrucosum TaxID=60171 RepID=UPI0025454AA5|nr:uncharacterized protein N7516_001702 [Penicillium verrucosum]KAJ5941534.1 hypothetical protein N7516_001702 [Penicillium verrucosum]
MGDHTRRSAFCRSPSLSSPSSDDGDTPNFSNEPTTTNNTAGSGPSWLPPQTTLDIIQAHLAADFDTDTSDISEQLVHPDFFVYLERLRRLNETTRVNARREIEAWHQAVFGTNESQNQASGTVNSQQQHQINESQYEASQMLDESQDEDSGMVDDSYQGSSQFTNEFSQPSYNAGADHGLRPSAMGVREQHGTQDPIAAESSGPIPHVHFETPDPTDTAARDHSHHHRPPSPYPTASRVESSSAPNPMPPTAMPAREPPRYTDWGNPDRFSFGPAPFPEGVTPYSRERIMQAWLIRQQLIAGIRPDDLEPMSVPLGRRHRTPPYMILNDSGAHIVRIEPAAFEGTMLPLPVLPWLPRRPNSDASTAPVSSNAQDASGLPTGPNIATAPDSASTLTPPDPPALTADPSSASTLNSSIAPDLSAAPNPPVAPDLSAVTNPPAPQTLPVDPSSASSLNSSVTPNSSAATNPPAPQTLPVDPSSASSLNSSVSPDSPAATNPPVASRLPAALTPSAAPSLTEQTVVSDPTYASEQSSEDPGQDAAESQNPDPRMVAFFQPLRLHEPANPTSASVQDPHPERPNASEPNSNENSQVSVVAPQSQSQPSLPLAVQNRTDTDSISSQEIHGVGVSPAHSQDRDSSTVSPLSDEGTETGDVPPLHVPNGNGVVHHASTLSEPEGPDEPAAPRLHRFAIDGADDSLSVGRFSGEVKAAGDQPSEGGLI